MGRTGKFCFLEYNEYGHHDQGNGNNRATQFVHGIDGSLNSKGKEINSKGTIHYNITNEFGNYNWAYEPYDGKIVLRLPAGKYKVNVKFDGDSHYRKIQQRSKHNTRRAHAYEGEKRKF